MSSQIQIRENHGAWMQVPSWAKFFIDLGYNWSAQSQFGRVITLISMPCDSAASGLTALGAIIRDLEKPEANDLDGHYEGLLRHAEQYLIHCKRCVLKKCEPGKKRCGQTVRALGRLRNKTESRKIYTVSDKTDVADKKLVLDVPGKHGGNRYVMSKFSLDWFIDGEPPVVLQENSESIRADIYSDIVDSSGIVSENLSSTFSGLCLAGRASGESVSRRMLSSFYFDTGPHTVSLDQLLTVSGWLKDQTVSRLVYFNTRNKKFDRNPASIRLVIADGEKAFLRALDEKHFQYADIIGIYRRTIDRDSLITISDRLLNLRQWYSDVAAEDIFSDVIPQGINATVLARKHS